jgi:glutaredoxin
MYNIYGLKWCVFCLRAIGFLHEKAEQFNYHPMDQAESTLNYIKETLGHKTVPIITLSIDGEEKLIGGYDDLVKHFRQQENQKSD